MVEGAVRNGGTGHPNPAVANIAQRNFLGGFLGVWGVGFLLSPNSMYTFFKNPVLVLLVVSPQTLIRKLMLCEEPEYRMG